MVLAARCASRLPCVSLPVRVSRMSVSVSFYHLLQQAGLTTSVVYLFNSALIEPTNTNNSLLSPTPQPPVLLDKSLCNALVLQWGMQFTTMHEIELFVDSTHTRTTCVQPLVSEYLQCAPPIYLQSS
jgi:hypothetical protein